MSVAVPAARTAGAPSDRFNPLDFITGRVSTVEYQDAESLLGWQRASASEVIAGRGQIVAEFFGVGCSRRVPWAR